MRLKPFLLALPLLGLPVVLVAQTAQTQPDSVGREATAPLRDTGIKKTKVADVLLLAASAPYSLQGMRSCAAISAEIRELNDALGNDIDVPAEHKGESAELAAAAARATVNTLIPGLGLVKVITGASKAEKRAEAAVYAGSVRRGFLKGVGLQRGCKVPAAPLPGAISDTPELPEED
jgi:hypothetical protein